MRRARSVRSNRRRLLAVALAACAPLPALPASAVANDAPVVANAIASPTSLTHLGGTVTVSADITDDSGVLDVVFIEVSGPSYWSTGMTREAGTDRWTGTVAFPQNFSPDPQDFQLDVRALDFEGMDGIAVAGNVQVAGEPPFDEAPLVYDPAVTPRDLPSTGGPVAIAVSAWDLRGISEAYAVVTGPGGATTHVALEPVSSDRFEGVFTAPANAGATAVQYSVGMTALDDIGQPGTVDGGVFTVAAAPKPTGRLQVNVQALDFGKAQVGHRIRRAVVVRNVGGKATVPVEGMIGTSGAPFFVAGAPATGAPFCLPAGKSMTFHVEFRPAAAGLRTGALRISRPDLVQPALSIPLAGTGIARKSAAVPLGTAATTKGCGA